MVAPSNILNELNWRGYHPERALLLPHDVVEHEDAYRRLLGNRGWTATEHVVMDNGAFELDAPVDSETVWRAVDITEPTCVVLPDHILDNKATVRAVESALNDWIPLAAVHHTDLMVIPQGKTWEEWCMCAEALAHHDTIQWWGIARNVRDINGVSRQKAVQFCLALNPSRKVHLFGFSEDRVDDIITASMPEVAAIDSTEPIRAGCLQQQFSITGPSLPPRGDWWNTATWDLMVLDNLNYATRVF
jgi:hypothetical protein